MMMAVVTPAAALVLAIMIMKLGGVEIFQKLDAPFREAERSDEPIRCGQAFVCHNSMRDLDDFMRGIVVEAVFPTLMRLPDYQPVC